MSEPITQAQDHDRRIGRLEGIAEQLDRRLDGIERAIADVRQDIRELRAGQPLGYWHFIRRCRACN